MAPVASMTDRDDPLTQALAPPPDETPEAREARLHAEAEARKHSDMIDEELNQERLAAKKGPKPVKILLLGQSESGKSTTLKNFQLMASPKAFKAERIVWRAVIQLNVVRSVHLILDTLSDLHAQQLARPSSSPAPAPSLPPPPELTPEHLRLKMRLSPLLQVEVTLVRRLSARGLGGAGDRDREVSVFSGSGWKGRFGRIIGKDEGRASFETARTHSRTPSMRSRAQSRAGSAEDDSGIDWDDPEDPGRVINACGEDMKKLWADPVVRRALEMQKMRLQEMSGFFLDQLDRVTQVRYIPTDDDILRARIKTLGVSEYRFTLNQKNSMISRDWIVFDVGGHRSLRAAWVPYFDDMNAIIFLAPISCFDQVLEEDERVNRLEDSVLLWNAIVANPLLARTTMVLFLNKCDILREKLQAGIQFGRYITSYGDRPNDFDTTSTYLKRKFTAVHKEKSPAPRPFYCHLTSVTDTKTTHLILWDVAESILRLNLEKSALIV